MDNYLILKHIHITFAISSIILFNLRFLWKMLWSDKNIPKIIKILPHINDTLLLLTGISMIILAGWIPFVNAMWLGVKLCCLVLYILSGAVAMRNTHSKIIAWSAYIMAWLNIGSIFYLAINKPF